MLTSILILMYGSGGRHYTMRIENTLCSEHLLIWHMSGCSFLCVLPDFLLRPVWVMEIKIAGWSVCVCVVLTLDSETLTDQPTVQQTIRWGGWKKCFLRGVFQNFSSVILHLLQVEVKQLETDIDNLRGACNQMSEKVTHLTAGKGE